MMYTQAEPMECSKCGSQRNYHFCDATRSGTRCADCGHEGRITEHQSSASNAWGKDPEHKPKF